MDSSKKVFGVFAENFAREFGEVLKTTGFSKGVGAFALRWLSTGFALFTLVLYYGLFEAQSGKIALLSIPCFFAPLVIAYFFRLYLFEERKKKIEEEVPDVLLLASSLPEKSDLKELVKFMASTGKGPIKEEFGKARKEIGNGMLVEEALLEMKKRNKSLSLGRALDLIINSLNSGAEMNSVFREAAEDFVQTNSIFRERQASLVVEKYTLLLGGGVIVPFTLGLISGMVSKLDFSSVSDLGIGMSTERKAEIASNAFLGNILYIAEYALIASAFVAFQENNSRKTVLYAIILLPLSLAAYFFGKTLNSI